MRRVFREAFRFLWWLFVGWLWLTFVSLVVAAAVAFTIEYFLVPPSAPPYVGYLVSGLSLFAATLLVLFSTGRTKRLGRGVLTAVLLLGALDVVTSLLTRFGADIPRVGYSVVLTGASAGIGAQLVNGVALLAGAAVFLFVRQLDTSEQRGAAESETGSTTEEPSANEQRDEKDGETVGEDAPRNVSEEAPSEDMATADENESATSYTI